MPVKKLKLYYELYLTQVYLNLKRDYDLIKMWHNTKNTLSRNPSKSVESVASEPLSEQSKNHHHLRKHTLKSQLKNYGFSLIELMVALSVLGIMLVIAIPSFRTMLFNSRLNATADALTDALNFARSTSLSQAITVRVCPVGATNSTTCGGNWSSGWIVITVPATGGSTLLKSQQTAPTDPVLTSTVANVSFDSHGLATTASNFKLCDSRGGTFALSIQVLATGYVQKGPTPGQAVWDNSALGCP